MKKNQVNNKVKYDISYALSNYIYNRLKDNQRLNSLRLLSIGENPITLDEYITLYDKYTKTISLVESWEIESNETLYVVKKDEIILPEIVASKDGLESFGLDSLCQKFLLIDPIFKNDLPCIRLEDAVNMLLIDLKEVKSKNVILSDEEIIDLKIIIEYYLNNKTLPEEKSCDEYTFITYVLNNLINDNNKKYSILASKYLTFFESCKSVGFEKRFMGSIDFGFSNVIAFENESHKSLFKVNRNNEIEKPYLMSDDYIIFARDIVFGLLREDDLIDEIPTRYIDKNKMYHDIVNNKYYQESDIKNGHFTPTITLFDYLKYYHLLPLYKDAYTLEEFYELSRSLKTNKDEEINQIADYVTDCAVNWWMNVIDVSEINKSDLIKFKESLTNKIVSSLINNNEVIISNEYDSNRLLARIANNLGVKIKFPWQVSMKVTMESIFIKSNDDYKKLEMKNHI